jgi:ABC-type branched-subunit amino acid transport system ATPase component
MIYPGSSKHIFKNISISLKEYSITALVGKSGVGKTTLSRFVSWMNNLSVY